MWHGRARRTRWLGYAGGEILRCRWRARVRLFFQHATEQQFRDVIEEITGRKVRGFVSGMDTHQDISSEVFYLQPLD